MQGPEERQEVSTTDPAGGVPEQTPPPPPPTPPTGPPVAVAPTDGQAIAALILGILGVIGVCPLIGSIIAIVLGRSAEKRIEASAGTLGGEGLAKAGWILGIIGVAMGLFFIVVFILVFAIGAAISIPFINMDINPTPTPFEDFGPTDLLRWL